jgi:hypothetical protein
MEDAFIAVLPPTGLGRVSGKVAVGWHDNSEWADVTVGYSAEHKGAHGGNSCQRIDVSAVKGDGRIQFVQVLHGISTGHVYRVSVWLRENIPIPIDVAIRQTNAPYQDFASTTVTPGNRWTKATFDWYASVDDPVYLMIRVTQPVTLWVDDASVAQTAPGAASIGNLIPNGSFETGLAGGWGAWALDGGFHDAVPALDSTTAFVGKSSLKVSIPSSEGAEVVVASPPVTIAQPGVYTACIALKVAGAPVPFLLSLENSKVSQNFVVKDQWQRVSITGVLPAGKTRLTLQSFGGSLPTTAVWVDAAELERRSCAPTAYLPANPVEMNLTTVQPGHVFFDRSPAVLDLATAGSIPTGSTVNIVVTDLYGGSYSFPPASPSTKSLTIPPARIHPYGMFKATAVLRDSTGHALSTPVECVYARLPSPREVDPRISFFGVHMPLQAAFFPIAREIGAHWVRLHDASQLTKWAVVQRNPGPFKYYDEQVVAARAAGLQILGMLDGAPEWTTVKPNPSQAFPGHEYWACFYNNPDKPDAPAYWRNYVHAMVSHYKGKIDYWEVWNEPWNVFFPGTPEQYGALLKIACATAKAANADAIILGVDAYRAMPGAYPEFAKRALQASGSAYYDAFSYHDYSPDTLCGSGDNIQLKDGRDFRELQRQYGNGPVKPQWTSEGGVGPGVMSMYGSSNDGTSLMVDQGRMVRFLVGLMAAGSRRFFLYTLYGGDLGAYGVTDIGALEYDRAIRPQLAAYAVLASLVDGAGTPSINNSVPGVCVFRFPPAAGKQVCVLWSYDSQTHRLSYLKDTKVIDVQGNAVPPAKTISIGPIPLYAVKEYSKSCGTHF